MGVWPCLEVMTLGRFTMALRKIEDKRLWFTTASRVQLAS